MEPYLILDTEKSNLKKSAYKFCMQVVVQYDETTCMQLKKC